MKKDSTTIKTIRYPKTYCTLYSEISMNKKKNQKDKNLQSKFVVVTLSFVQSFRDSGACDTTKAFYIQSLNSVIGKLEIISAKEFIQFLIYIRSKLMD